MIKNITAALVLIGIIACATGHTASAAPQTIDVTSNPVATMVADGVTDNHVALQAILDTADSYYHTTITVPAGNNLVNDRVLMRSNVTFNFMTGAKFITSTWSNYSYFTTLPGYEDGIQNVTWNNAYFSSVDGVGRVSVSMVHAKNITYNNTTWYRALGNGNHLLDIMGSSYITVKNSKILGATNDYGSALDTSLKEAIQVSYATRASLGGNALDATPEVFDSMPSHHITVDSTSFMAVYNADGSVLSYAPVPIGEHGNVAGLQIHDIVFTNNYILDPISKTAVTATRAGYWAGYISFPSVRNLLIEGNTFEYKEAPVTEYMISLESYATIAGMLPIQDVTIRNNTFINVEPTKAYILAHVKPGAQGTTPINNLIIEGNTVRLNNPAVHVPFFERLGAVASITATETGTSFIAHPTGAPVDVPVVKVPNAGIESVMRSPLLVAILGLSAAAVVMVVALSQHTPQKVAISSRNRTRTVRRRR